MLNIVFMGTPEFAAQSLSRIIKSHHVRCVYTQPDRPAGRGKKLRPSEVKLFAQKSGIEVRQPNNLKSEAASISSINPDVIVVVAYGLLLPNAILDVPRFGCINVHASLLPRWRGAAPIQRAIEAGDNRSGVCIMQMDAGLDTGPVFARCEVPINADTTAGALHDQLASAGANTLAEVLEAIENGTATAEPQSDVGECYAAKINRTEAHIDWCKDANSIERKIRAFNPWPICTTSYNGNNLRILRASASARKQDASPGEVISIDQNTLLVACGVGALQLTTLQKPGGRALTTKEFLNGNKVARGDLFGTVLN